MTKKEKFKAKQRKNSTATTTARSIAKRKLRNDKYWVDRRKFWTEVDLSLFDKDEKVRAAVIDATEHVKNEIAD